MTEAFPDRLLCSIPAPVNEAKRLEALRRYEILDTPPEIAFDRITTLAARLFDAPIALVSLVDASRAWFKSCYGFELQEVRRDNTICSVALLYDDVLVVPDTQLDDRFTCNPFVQADPGLRFYAGAPLITHDGFTLGTLCLLDMKPRPDLTDAQKATLSDLAAMVVDELELRLAARRMAQIDTALLEVTKGVAAATGDAFFLALVQQFTKTLGVDYAFIGLVDSSDHFADRPDTVKTIAVCADGEIIDNFEYSLRGTPCQEVLQTRKLCLYPSGVQSQFPHAPLLVPLQVDSYAAIPFFDSVGAPLGLLAVMGRTPLSNLQLAESLLTIFALRIATELERQQTESDRQQAQQELARLIEQRTAELSQANELLRREIAERQQTEVALQKEQETLKVLLDNVQAGIVACNAEGILTLFNQAAREFHGLPEQPLPASQWAEHYDLYLPDGTTRMSQTEIPLFRALQGEILYNVEMMIVPKQGAARTLLASGQAIVDVHGQKQGAVVIMHDITERKQAEEERAELAREQAARALAEISQQAAEQAAERTARLQAVTAALSQSLTPYQVADVIVEQSLAALGASSALVVLLTDDRTELEIIKAIGYEPDLLEAWQRFPVTADVPLAAVVRTGEPTWLAPVSDRIQRYPHLAEIYSRYDFKAWMALPLTVEGKTLGGILLSFQAYQPQTQDDRDFVVALTRQGAQAISRAQLYEAERKARADAERANQVKDEFLAVLSHELRSPLNPILGWSKLLQTKHHDAVTLTRGLQTIERNAKLQTQLIEDLLDVSRILRGKLNLDKVPVDLKSTIEAAMETVRLTAEAKAIELQFTVNDGRSQETPSTLAVPYPNSRIQTLGDAGRLQQVIWNLLSNAVKFTPEGGRVEVYLERKLSHDAGIDQASMSPSPYPAYAQITVTDTGKGITPEFLPYIFDRFRQADSKTTRKFGGLGLGLAIARHLVELHGGTIQVSSPGEGLGATFVVKLPLVGDQASGIADWENSPNSSSPVSHSPLTGLRILVVDDETDARELVVFILKQAGASVTPVTSAIEALHVLKTLEMDLVISDVGMPDMDGYMLMQQIDTQFAVPSAKRRKPPAIALTAYAGELNQQKALAAGFQRHLTKPIEPVALVDTIVELTLNQTI
ncbi:GAF domain-containing protein [Thermocoleostomius sinensis]|uniref:histidine kinase n=1 Tax=Thermocoleostomius sinensis A174 TaxID=2016057 RepID=A0A9E9C6M3_9CYAN|nr:GAF domain-containing protein [Thermocoleostomius sinensis]WAL62416.1 ATP-binding protein [Thermocoleostomius sinensis A174]